MLDSARKTSSAMLSRDEILIFRRALLEWFDRHKRDLPWRRTGDPYAIWVSEIMLQQTRVAAALPFYERFLKRFPDAGALAEASEADLLTHWAGLGYYYRARNMQDAARSIREQGAFPSDYKSIRLLPGVGEYTAAAVASIAFQLPHAAVDGNVLRVLSRLLADPTDIGTMRGRSHFAQIAHLILDESQPGAFNQAMMELGATVCLPKNPQCLICPAAQICRGRQSGKQNIYPAKLIRVKSVEEGRVLFWIERDGKLLVWQRPADARLMPGFWELPEKDQLPAVDSGELLSSFRHGITFHNYRFEVRRADSPADIGLCRWIGLAELESVPASTVLRKAVRAVNQGSQKAVAAGRAKQR